MTELPGLTADRSEQALREELLQTINQLMPFGRYKGRRLIELPEPYLVWFHGQGFPDGVLGRRLALMHEIKVNGLEKMLQPLIRD